MFHSFNGFPVATSDEFAELTRATGGNGAGAAKPTALDTASLKSNGPNYLLEESATCVAAAPIQLDWIACVFPHG